MLLALGALDAAGYSVIVPALPTIARHEHAGPALIGALVSVHAAGTIAGYVLAGLLVARRGTRSALLTGIVLIVLGSLGFVLGGGLAAYFVGRFAMGVGSGGLWIGATFALLERSQGREYMQMSRLLAAYSVGALLGPALGALGGVRGPFLVYLLLAAASLPFLLALRGPSVAQPRGSGREALHRPGFRLAAAGILFALLALGTVDGVLPLHFASSLSQAQIAGLFVGMSLVVGASAAIAGSLPPRPTLAAALVFVVAGIALAGAAGSVGAWLPALALAGVGVGLGETAATGVLLEAGTGRVVVAMVVWSQLGLFGYLAGPLAGGGVADGLGYGWVVLVPVAAAAPVAWLLARSRR